MKSISIRPIIFLVVILLFASCNLTSTKTKSPSFIDINKAQKELANLIASENFNLNGKEVTQNKKATSELEVSIINGQKIPTNESERKALGKLIAKTIKNNLKDRNAYDSYSVLFVTKTETGGVTKHDWVGNAFSSSELE